MNHNPESQAYRLEIAGRSVAFTGDTLWTDAILDLARGADLLVIDCTFREKALGSHLTYREIVEHRDEIEAERIVLTHFAELPPARSRVSGLVRGRDGLSLDL
jgi:ribonuclease BN (tRNA processing enzyme)